MKNIVKFILYAFAIFSITIMSLAGSMSGDITLQKWVVGLSMLLIFRKLIIRIIKNTLKTIFN